MADPPSEANRQLAMLFDNYKQETFKIFRVDPPDPDVNPPEPDAEPPTPDSK